MNVLLLSPYPDMITPALEMAEDNWFHQSQGLRIRPPMDLVVVFGHRYILQKPFLDQHPDRIINIHISMLPWNRGADPNFWSWFDDTPKGVTIHRIDEGIDTGNILVQQEVTKWRTDETLSSSWHYLMAHAKKLFEDNWVNIRRDALPSRKAEDNGTYHRRADKAQWFEQLPLGWNTPVKEIKRLGRKHRASGNEKENRHPRPRKHRQQTFKEL